MDVPFRYGSRELVLPFAEDATLLTHHEPSSGVGPEQFRQLLEEKLPAGSSLGDRLPGKVGIVVADKTRRCQYPLYLPVLCSFLEERGVEPGNITFFIAYGTHSPQSDEVSRDCYGEVYKRYRFVHHDSRTPSGFISLGRTSRGTEVELSGRAMDCDLLISFGAILHHYFAGFGGGRKLFFPGLAAYGPILHNHSLFIDFVRGRTHTGCRSGQLDGNPLAEDLAEIGRMLPEHLEVHAILNSRKEVCELYAGPGEDAFLNTCDRYASFFSSPDPGGYDMVLASAGGSPRDLNMIQAHKALHHAASFVRKGGKLVFLAACNEGIGNDQWPELFKAGGPRELAESLRSKYPNNGGTALSFMEKSEAMDIFMLTELDERLCQTLGVEKLSEASLKAILAKHSGSLALIPQAALLYRKS